LRNYTNLRIVAVLVVVAGVVTGCSLFKTAQDTTAPAPTMGIVDMQTVIKNHPKYASLQQALKDYEVLAAQVQTERAQAMRQTGSNLPPALNGARDEVTKEFNAKLAAKENELKTQLGVAADQARMDAQSEFDAYKQEQDKIYQPQIFSLQLKLKTVQQMTKDEQAATQAELDRLQNEYNAKLTAKHQELVGKINDLMTAKQADAKRQGDAYAQDLISTMNNRLKTLQMEALKQANVASTPAKARSEKEQQLAMKQQEITVLQDTIINDIRDKAAKVAAQNGLEVVLADVKVNVHATDITNMVIAEFKK